MTKFSFATAFALGLAIVAWIGLGFAGASWLPIVVTAVILAVYLAGAFELQRFRAATDGLRAAVQAADAAPASLEDWLARVPATLRGAVRTRVESERGLLPGPALTPYLVGLLVMLGMLGTFLGMVVTFKGAVFALEGSTDLTAIRSALAEPVRGLGLSFGTSVAGVAASAMLGLMSAICRRERLDVARALEARIATTLQPFSLAHQRAEGLRALQAQARALPEVVDALQSLMQRIEARSVQLDQQLLERHGQFQREAGAAYGELARSVGASLQESLAAGAQAAGDTIRPVVEGAMAQVVREAQALHTRLQEVTQAQVDALSRQFGDTARTVSASWNAALQEHVRGSEATRAGLQQALAGFTQDFGERSTQLLDDLHERIAGSEAAHGRRLDELTASWRGELAGARAQEERRGEQAVARLGELQAAVAQHLATLGAALEAPITRLLQTAAEVPQAAAGVITQLREEISRVAERDNLALQERTVLLERLDGLLQSVNRAAGEQRAATEGLVAAASSVLEEAGTRFADVLGAQAQQASDTSAHIAAGAVELASVAEAFTQGVQQFQASNEHMIASLQRVEASLDRSTARSDEQLAYYVAQAREVIDLSIASQQGLVENLRELQAKPRKAAPVAEGVAG
jgi:hypothetical protein